MSKFEVLACVLCDEVRAEASGKSILIGALNRGPTLQEDCETVVPRLSFYIEAIAQGVKKAKVRLVHQDTMASIFDDEFELNLDDRIDEIGSVEDWTQIEANMQLVINLVDLTFPTAGRYILEVAYDDADWLLVRDYMFFESKLTPRGGHSISGQDSG